MQIINLTEKDLAYAKKCHEYRKSIKNSKSIHKTEEETTLFNLVGIIGEICFKKLFPESVHIGDKNVDFQYNGKLVDVKCKHYNSFLITDDHEMSIPAYTLSKIIHNLFYSVFILNHDFTKCYYFGTIPKDKYCLNSFFMKQGQGVFRVDSHVMKLNRLRKLAISEF